MGRANKNNFIPGGNSKPTSLGSNTTPRGKGAGSWVSGRSSTKSQKAASYKPQTSFSQKGAPRGWNPTWNQFASSPSKGLSYKPYDAVNSNNLYRRPTTLKGTNFNINTRSSSTLAKGLGGGVAIQATKGGLLKGVLTKANPYVFALLLIADIVLADGGIVSNEDELAAIEEWNRQPGESKVIQEGVVSFTGGQTPGVQYRVIIEYNRAYTTNITDRGATVWGKVIGIDVQTDVNGNDAIGVLAHETSSGTNQKFYAVDVGSVARGAFQTQRILSIFRIDGQPDTGGNPSPSGEIKSSPTVNHNNITINKADNPSLPSIIRPSLSSDRTASPTQSKATGKIPLGDVESNTSSSGSNVTPQPKINNPSPTPEPLPTPEPPEEKTIEEAEQEQTTPKQKAEPEIISKTKARRADGTIETTIVKEATEDEMKEFKKKVATANRELDDAQKVIEKDREFRELRRNIQPYGDETEFFYRTRKNDSLNPTVEETTRQPSSNAGSPPASAPLSNAPSVISKPIPEPDAPTPEPTPEPVIQTKVPNNVIEDKIDKLPNG